MKCELCGAEFEPLKSFQRFCSANCASKYRNSLKRSEELEKIQRRQEREKRLSKWLEEAAQCGMSYGKYRAAIEHFGKTFEELKL